MPEYLIFFNDEWVTDASDAEWQERSQAARAVVEEMKAAGVFIFTGGLDNDAPAFHVVPEGGIPVVMDGPYAETEETFGGFAAVDVPDEAAARYWAGRIAVACGWPQEVRILRTPAQVPTPDADREAAANQA
ncbi:MAG TPA: YciI family protein [Acidimicrobiales bacterium]|nr:YciI family protein [Acidimicrobiales bacterium]